MFVFPPETTVTTPGEVRSETTKTESDIVSQPSGLPWKKFPLSLLTGSIVVSVASLLRDFRVGLYQYLS